MTWKLSQQSPLPFVIWVKKLCVTHSTFYRPQTGLLPYKGRGSYPKNKRPLKDPVSVYEIARDPLLCWEIVSIGEGAKGPIMVEVACLRIIEKRDCLPGKECWLFFRKNADGEIKYSGIAT